MLLQKKMARKKGVVDFKQEKKKKMNKRKPKKKKKKTHAEMHKQKHLTKIKSQQILCHYKSKTRYAHFSATDYLGRPFPNQQYVK